jgi:hypothetical protein
VRQCLAETKILLEARKVEVVLILACANEHDEISCEEHTYMLEQLVVMAKEN